jgi:hypothetical protein
MPVLPIGLFLRVGLEGTGWITYEESLWEEDLLQFRYPYIGLPKLPALQHLEGENLLGVALSALMQVEDADRARLKAEALQRLATAQVDAARRYLLCECVEAYLPLEGPNLVEFEHLLQSPKFQEANMVAKTSFEKGRDEGRNETQLPILKQLLQKRMGQVPSDLWGQIEAMSFEHRAKLTQDLLNDIALDQLGLPSGLEKIS